VNLGFLLLVGDFVAKSWRIFSLYSNKSVEITRIRDSSVWGIISILLSIDIVMCRSFTLSFVLDPFNCCFRAWRIWKKGSD